MSYTEIKGTINSTLGTDDFKPLDQILNDNFATRGSAVFTESGTFIVPDGVNILYVTGCAAGGDGTIGNRGSMIAGSKIGSKGGSGGSAGEYIERYPIDVTINKTISVVVGTGNTIIGDLVLIKGGNTDTTLQSGAGGTPGNETSGVSFSCPGGKGGSYRGSGFTGTTDSFRGNSGGGGGGAGSYFGQGGKGGNGDFSVGTGGHPGLNGTGYGSGGGGGGGATGYDNLPGVGGKGAPGIVIIEW